MSDNVHQFPGLTTPPISVERVLEGAKAHERVVVIGTDESGVLSIASSGGEPESDFVLLHQAARRLLDMIND